MNNLAKMCAGGLCDGYGTKSLNYHEDFSVISILLAILQKSTVLI